jgi:hypothetical protein
MIQRHHICGLFVSIVTMEIASIDSACDMRRVCSWQKEKRKYEETDFLPDSWY